MYNRTKAVEYAHKWALGRNPKYYDFEKIGGDCTNFISQCLYAGGLNMNYAQDGWFYINGNNKSPSWTGVNFLYNYLINKRKAKEIQLYEIEVGDIIQLSSNGQYFTHSIIVSKIKNGEIFICCHTADAKDKNINKYSFKKMRILKIL